MSTFGAAIRRIEQYRICLERDAEAGIVPSEASEAVDRCYRTLETVLRSARVELEGAGALQGRDDGSGHLVSSCSMLALEMFRRMYSEPDAVRLRTVARSVREEGQALIEHLWARLESTAA